MVQCVFTMYCEEELRNDDKEHVLRREEMRHAFITLFGTPEGNRPLAGFHETHSSSGTLR
jgi:hypothetical protein